MATINEVIKALQKCKKRGWGDCPLFVDNLKSAYYSNITNISVFKSDITNSVRGVIRINSKEDAIGVRLN
jgi:hypothetical protein